MRLPSPLRTLIGLAVAGLAVIAPAPALAHGGEAVFTETNAGANAVQVYQQAADGTLTPGASYLTGGAGSGAAGLGSQGALALERGWLLAVNAGSNDVSAFRVRGSHLELVNRVPSGGTTPNSVTIHGGVAYVLNSGGTGSITGFRLGRHGLAPLSGATQPLSSATAGAVQVSFTPRGDQLVVSEKGANVIDTYPVDRWGRAGAGTAHASAGAAPFGFAFGKHDSLLVTEAAASALTSYQLDPFATITASLPNGQGAACWAASTRDGRAGLHRQRRDRLHLGVLGGLERHALAADAGRRHGPAGRGHHIRSTRRSRMTASSTSTAATAARSTRSRSAGTAR